MFVTGVHAGPTAPIQHTDRPTAPTGQTGGATASGRVDGPARAGPLRLARVVVDPGVPPTSGHGYAPAVAGYLADLAGLHGLPDRPADFAGAARTTFTDLVRPLVAEVAGKPTELVVLAHVTPDAEPGWPASFLTGALPGAPLAFAVADQGVAAPFTALRIAQAYAGAEDFDRALVVLLDQGTFLTAGAPPPVRTGLVAVLLERAGELGAVSTRVLSGVAPHEVRPALATALAEFPGAVVTGPAAAPPAGRPATGGWRRLARRLPTGPSSGAAGAKHPVALAEYDVTARCLGVCVVTPAAAGGTAGHEAAERPEAPS
ncbi:hypothetical protein [Plantactinospora sp. GCM10030261]|uniref:hypothetical protein n=1 Tax=Plantactinospora sp. GCM10030261 TaxID=3273420 RepID=UPI00361D5AE5